MPRYPFSPELLDALPEELAELFRGLELTLLEEICSRLKISGQFNEGTVQDIRALRAHGIGLEDIKRAVAGATDTGADKLNALLDGVVARNQAYYAEMAGLAGVTAPERLVDERDIAAIRRQTWGAYKNITGSMGFLVMQGGRLTFLEPAKAYQWALDSAELQIQSGAVSYNQAIASAIRQLADSGIKTVRYESGRMDSVDVAVRRAVMTGVNQLNQKYREQSMDYLETDLVEVTAHLGARNTDGPNGWENHAKWQGKVYRWKRGGKQAPPERRETPSPELPALPIQQEPVSSQAAPRRAAPVDVTREYLDTATPGVGAVTYDNGYKVGKHRDEIAIAEWLRDTFGGDVRLLKESSEKNQETPDYIWHSKLWELKGTHSISGADKRFQHAIKQIQGNPGGVILDILEDINMAALEQQLVRRFYRKESEIGTLDLMILSKGKLVKILRYKK